MAKAVSPTDIETRTIRKVRSRIIPFIMVLMVIASLDRMNIGFAALTMNKELAITSQQYGFLAGVFFLGYFTFEIPSNLLLHRIGARVWLARILISWGIVAMLTGFVKTASHVYVLRFLLGVAEAGYFPGIVLYLTYWFPQRQLARNIALFITANPVANILGAPVSGVILDHAHWFGVSSWRWLLILEGVPAIIGGILTYFLLPGKPAEARFLTAQEKEWIATERAREEQQKIAAHPIGAGRALAHGRVWYLTVIYFMAMISWQGMSLWLPQLMKDSSGRSSNTTVGILVMIPYLVALVAMILVAHRSDRTLERRYHTAVPLIIGAISLALLATSGTGSVLVSVTLWCFAVSGACCLWGPFWSLPNEFLAGYSAAAGIALINSIGNLGGFVGSYTIGTISKRTGSFHGGLVFLCISFFATATLMLALRKGTRREVVSFAPIAQPNPAAIPTADVE
jgi:ACS family tartrate transporter-like MFS transporter